MPGNVLVVAEHRDGDLKKVTLEMLGEGSRIAAELGGVVEAALLGAGVGALANPLAHYGAARVYLADDPALRKYSSEGYTTPPSSAAILLPSPNISRVTFFRSPSLCSATTRTLPGMSHHLRFFPQQAHQLPAGLHRSPWYDPTSFPFRWRTEGDNLQPGAGSTDGFRVYT